MYKHLQYVKPNQLLLHKIFSNNNKKKNKINTESKKNQHPGGKTQILNEIISNCKSLKSWTYKINL